MSRAYFSTTGFPLFFLILIYSFSPAAIRLLTAAIRPSSSCSRTVRCSSTGSLRIGSPTRSISSSLLLCQAEAFQGGGCKLPDVRYPE